MLDRLFDFIWSIVDLLFFVEIVDAYQGGVVLRWGKFHREVAPGACFYIPFGVERVILASVVMDNARMAEQTFTLQDGVTITVVPVITYRVHNVRKHLLEVEDAEGSLQDAAAGVIRKVLTPHNWAEFVNPKTSEEIEEEAQKAVRAEAFKWGVEILRVQFPDLVRQDQVVRVYGVDVVLGVGPGGEE